MKKKKVIAALLLCLLPFCLAGCKDSNEKYIGMEGIVVGKKYDPGHTHTSMIYNGKFFTPIVNSVPDRWYLTVEYSIDGETESAKYRVSESTYTVYEVGDLYIYQGNKED